ncbi:hypothetical protein BN7_2691 [Wickerhamomyces ciferrii]|uniref:PH domain-containing protein n=1 Tax=Wickerhamomyces ciferrii (strain ATCC 14091 / BCRC 22168 / CBS 111 / JCM 3599 / NBRC 0793 / NRRL Y-1031 F-60-10) TaxID=1206466 RepID=K0KP28_WICCF|nr:uncharacterized protein BN7_2691 [Wickerhamomyces ciferrii]CCH43144.1 hypothetical protein BN7_2691 [Wickerhamomyces ciferrii]
MSNTPSAKAIEQVLEKQRAKGKSLDESISYQLSIDLKNHLINKSQDSLKSIILLANVLRLSKPNELFTQILDYQIFNGIFQNLTKSTPSEYILSVFTIINLLIKGDLLGNVDQQEYLPNFLRALDDNLGFLKILSTKLYTENVDLIIKSLDFLNNYLNLNHGKLYTMEYLINFFFNLQKTEFNSILINILQDQRFKQLLNTSIKNLNHSFLNTLNLLNSLKIDQSSQLQITLINETQILSFSNEKKQNQQFILTNYSVLQLIDFYFFSQSSNISFKKSYQEQILFNNNKENYFPLIQISTKITSLLLNIFQQDSDYENLTKISIFLRDLLHFNLISKFLEIWNESNSQKDELNNLLPLIEILLKIINDEFQNDELHIIDKILSIFKKISYQDLREYQLNSIKNLNLNSTLNEINSFDKILQNQVFDFIKNQRFLQLSKGAWVYSSLPNFQSITPTQQEGQEGNNEGTNYFFIILSPNFKNLLFKEYKFKTQNLPDIDKSGIPIEISSISSFKIEEIQQSDPTTSTHGPNNRFINLVEKSIINKITLINRKNKPLFTFFAKKEDSFNYLDALNLLLGHYDNLSDELTYQINKLFKIRKSVQLLNFNYEESNVVNNDEVGDDVYDLDNLEKLASNFYYS